VQSLLCNYGNQKWKSIDISRFANASQTVHDAKFDCVHRKVCWLLLLRCKNCRLSEKKCVLDFTIFAGTRMTVKMIDLRLWSQIIIHFIVVQFVSFSFCFFRIKETN
jgi:hypothetical protein